MHISSNLLFLTNEVMNPLVYKTQMRIPLQFVSFGYVKGRMGTFRGNKHTFVTLQQKTRVNPNVYGALFLIEDFAFYIRLLDAYHACSLGNMHRNHEFDHHHRLLCDVTPIHFDSINEFQRLKYRESDTVKAHIYNANRNHPIVTKRLNNKIHPHRVVSGVDAKHFKQLYREVTHLGR